ncbi:MAG: LysM peptidoglycan-binding domain-containing protein [Bacteroidales bacterium]|nr:LysM peptidoglycan-binding domain-containing protein [Bacteroidales bacterium]
MDCPICNYPGLREEADHCPRCNADLSVFRQIHELHEQLKRQKTHNMILYIMMMFIGMGWAYTYYFVGTQPDKIIRMEVDQKNQEIIDLQRENSRLRTMMVDVTDLSNDVLKNTKSKNVSQPKTQPKAIKPKAKTEYKPTALPKAKTPVATDPDLEYYTIKTGETLYAIAKKVYGDGHQYKKLMKDNNIKDAGDIKVGQKLKIYPPKK